MEKPGTEDSVNHFRRVCVCVSVCICLFSSTVKASSDCKIFEINLRDTDQRSSVVGIIPGASAKLLPLGI